jgi:hypothetical protein
MEIRPVSADQIKLGQDGRMYEVTGEAGRVVKHLQAIDESIVAHFNEGGNFFTIAQRLADPADPLRTRDFPVMRVHPDDWDDRIASEFRMRFWELRHGVSAADRLDAQDDQRKADAQYRLEQEVGEAVAPLFHAFQRDIGVKPRIFLPARKTQRALASAA